MSRIQRFNQRRFHYNPGRPGRAASGLCSLCWRGATWMLIREDGRPLLAYCSQHKRIRELKNQIEGVRMEMRLIDHTSVAAEAQPTTPTPIREGLA